MNRTDALSFIDLPDERDLETVDRSTLQGFAECPAMAVNILRGRCNTSSIAANAGEEVHKAFSQATQYYIDNFVGEDMRNMIGSIADEFLIALRSSRPDVQPQVIDAGKYSAYAWARYLTDRHPDNILHYDGGVNQRSGQLAWDLDGLNVRVTSELDFLTTTNSPDVLEEIDYKTGWKRYTIDTIAARFQFRLHAWLVFCNYEEIKALSVKVWQPRMGGPGYPVYFDRKHMGEYEAQIRHAAGLYVQHRDDLPELAPTWPAVEKCSICPAAALCPAAGQPAHEIAADPIAYVERMHAIDANLGAMREVAAAHVKVTGRDIITPSGLAFGVEKPVKSRKENKLYSIKQEEPPDAEVHE